MTALSERSFGVKHMNHAFAKPTTQFNLCQYACKVRGTTYLAGQERFVGKGDELYLNLWSGSDVVPVKGDWPTIAAHFEYVIKDSNERQHWYSYLACKFQRPHLKLKHVLLLTGGQGIGKSFFGALFKFLLGSRNVGIAETSHLRSEFNSVFVNKELIIIEELMAAKHLETENMMKPLISETTIMCNEKCIPRFEAMTPLAFIAFSNYEKCINLSEDDRRWHAVHSEAEKQSSEYYDKLFAAIETEGPAFMYYLLYEHDLSGFNPNAAPPMTKAKQNLIHRSLPPLRAALGELIEEGNAPFHKDVISTAELDAALCMRPNVSPRSREPRKVADALKQMGRTPLGQRMVKGNRHSLWVIRNQEKWSQASSQTIGEEFCR